MRDLETIAYECMEKLDALAIPYGNVTEISVNYRAKSRWGQCRHGKDGTHSININAELLDERNDVRGLENTILHELLHTCPGCNNHGEIWKTYAEKVNAAYGYNIKRCSDAYEKGIAGAEKSENATTYRRPVKHRNVTKYSTRAVEDFIAETLMPKGYDVVTIDGYWLDSYICVAPEGHMNFVFRANDVCGDPWYTMRRCRKISAALQSEINAAYDKMYG